MRSTIYWQLDWQVPGRRSEFFATILYSRLDTDSSERLCVVLKAVRHRRSILEYGHNVRSAWRKLVTGLYTRVEFYCTRTARMAD